MKSLVVWLVSYTGELTMSVWRLLKLETHSAFMNMAIDEAVLRVKMENLVPNTLRFYCWNPSAVSIGRFQDVENEVLLDNCRSFGVDVVRRITGGGTVYHSAEDEITYSVVVRKSDLDASDITSVYAKIYDGLAGAVKILGLRADFNVGDKGHCPNITVNGRKISGSAQCHKGGVVLQHGTFLVDVDLKKMFTFLRVPWGKTCLEVAGVARRKITSIREALGRDVSIAEVNEALINGFQKALSIKLVDGELTDHERELAEKLFMQKYATIKWNFEGRSVYEK
jgi:lipoate-protein ligase A